MRNLSSTAAVAVLACLCAALAGCGESPAEKERARAVQLIKSAGCGGCHEIPGVDGAEGRVGPPLKGVGGRTFLAGMIRNTPENMVAWLKDPQAIAPGNAMPNMGLSDKDARTIAFYLDRLR
ncbi:MAG: c-type cytochrome [Hansschlegelia sp.]